MNEIIGNYKLNARKRGREFSLTREECVTLFKSPCHYCGVTGFNVHNCAARTMSNGKRWRRDALSYNGIDRLYNDRGYVIGNVVACCKNCNLAKRALTPYEFIAMAHRIVRHCRAKERLPKSRTQTSWSM